MTNSLRKFYQEQWLFGSIPILTLCYSICWNLPINSVDEELISDLPGAPTKSRGSLSSISWGLVVSLLRVLLMLPLRLLFSLITLRLLLLWGDKLAKTPRKSRGYTQKHMELWERLFKVWFPYQYYNKIESFISETSWLKKQTTLELKPWLRTQATSAITVTWKTTSALITEAREKVDMAPPLERRSCTHYPILFEKNQAKTHALIDSDNEVNTISRFYGTKLGLKRWTTDVEA